MKKIKTVWIIEGTKDGKDFQYCGQNAFDSCKDPIDDSAVIWVFRTKKAAKALIERHGWPAKPVKLVRPK